MPNTDRDWRKWGRADPYFAVLASPEFARENIAENKAAFFLTGEQFITAMLDAQGSFPTSTARDRALEHGCGTGRLTIPLSRAYREVVALDISAAMLAEAGANARAAGRSNIAFALADDILAKATGSFDLVVSHLVLQHIPVRRGMAIFRGLIDRVSPGGMFYISVSIRTDRGAKRWLYWASAVVPGVKVVQNLLRGAPWNAPAMQMNHYPLSTMVGELTKRGIEQLSLTVDTYHSRFQTVSLQGVKPAV